MVWSRVMTAFFLRPACAPLVVLSVTVLSLVCWLLLPSHVTMQLLQEGGLVENLTVALYGVAILIVLTWRPDRLDRRTAFAIALLLAAMAARELDLHAAVTDISVLKLRFWTRAGHVPEKLLAISVIAPVVLCAVYLAKRYLRPLMRAARTGDTIAVTLATCLATLFAAKAIDRSLGIIKNAVAFQSPDWLRALQLAIEEPYEMLLPVLAVIALVQSHLQRRG